MTSPGFHQLVLPRNAGNGPARQEAEDELSSEGAKLVCETSCKAYASRSDITHAVQRAPVDRIYYPHCCWFVRVLLNPAPQAHNAAPAPDCCNGGGVRSVIEWMKARWMYVKYLLLLLLAVVCLVSCYGSLNHGMRWSQACKCANLTEAESVGREGEDGGGKKPFLEVHGVHTHKCPVQVNALRSCMRRKPPPQGTTDASKALYLGQHQAASGNESQCTIYERGHFQVDDDDTGTCPAIPMETAPGYLSVAFPALALASVMRHAGSHHDHTSYQGLPIYLAYPLVDPGPVLACPRAATAGGCVFPHLCQGREAIWRNLAHAYQVIRTVGEWLVEYSAFLFPPIAVLFLASVIGVGRMPWFMSLFTEP